MPNLLIVNNQYLFPILILSLLA